MSEEPVKHSSSQFEIGEELLIPLAIVSLILVSVFYFILMRMGLPSGASLGFSIVLLGVMSLSLVTDAGLLLIGTGLLILSVEALQYYEP